MTNSASQPVEQPAKPSAALKQLDKLIGTWKVTGEATGQITYEWLEGGFFLVQRVDVDHDGHKIKGIEIIGHEHKFGEAPSEDIKSRFYSNTGDTLDYVYEMEGDTLTIWGGAKGSPAYYRGKFSDDGSRYDGRWVWPGGGYGATATRIGQGDTMSKVQNSDVNDTVTSKVQSADGTTIAFDKVGKGPALILVGGLLEQRAMDSATAQLAALPLLAQHFTVFHYDRRGRGGSTDTQPYAVEREIEDIEALINQAGGSAFVSGISSGAALAMEATIKLGNKIKKLAMYEAPYNDDAPARQAWKEFRKRLKEVLAANRRGDAVALFMMLTGMPADHVPALRQHPMWPMWEAVAPTLAYDAAVLGEDASIPIKKAARVAVPALVMDGGAGEFPFMHITAMALAKAMLHAQHRTLEGQTHEVAAEALAPVLVEFFNSNAATR